jgi:NAD-dependent deacetylase
LEKRPGEASPCPHTSNRCVLCSTAAAARCSSPARASAPSRAFRTSAVPAASGRGCSRSISRSFSRRQRNVASRGAAASTIARLIASGKASAVITQNVDNLHQVSGVPENKVIELHGNATYARCLGCALRVELAEIEREFQASGNVGPCQACGGILKSATISFGQPMPQLPMQRAHEETMACDLFIVLGSSLSVFPAADFPLRAKQNGATLVIVNRDPTEMDEIADLVIHEGIGATLGAVSGDN